MANAKISALPVSTLPLAGKKVLPIVQSSNFFTSKITLFNYEITSATSRLVYQAIFGNRTRIDSCKITNFV